MFSSKNLFVFSLGILLPVSAQNWESIDRNPNYAKGRNGRNGKNTKNATKYPEKPLIFTKFNGKTTLI